MGLKSELLWPCSFLTPCGMGALSFRSAFTRKEGSHRALGPPPSPRLLNVLCPAPSWIQCYWSRSSPELCPNPFAPVFNLDLSQLWPAWLTFIFLPTKFFWLVQSHCYIQAPAKHLTKLMSKPWNMKQIWNMKTIASLCSCQAPLSSFPFVLNGTCWN